MGETASACVVSHPEATNDDDNIRQEDGGTYYTDDIT